MATKQKRDEFFDRIQGGDFVRVLLLVMCKHAPRISFGSDGSTGTFNVESFKGQCTEEMYSDFKDLIFLVDPEFPGTGMCVEVPIPQKSEDGVVIIGYRYHVCFNLPIEPYFKNQDNLFDFFTLFVDYCKSIGIEC